MRLLSGRPNCLKLESKKASKPKIGVNVPM